MSRSWIYSSWVCWLSFSFIHNFGHFVEESSIIPHLRKCKWGRILAKLFSAEIEPSRRNMKFIENSACIAISIPRFSSILCTRPARSCGSRGRFNIRVAARWRLQLGRRDGNAGCRRVEKFRDRREAIAQRSDSWRGGYEWPGLGRIMISWMLRLKGSVPGGTGNSISELRLRHWGFCVVHELFSTRGNFVDSDVLRCMVCLSVSICCSIVVAWFLFIYLFIYYIKSTGFSICRWSVTHWWQWMTLHLHMRSVTHWWQWVTLHLKM